MTSYHADKPNFLEFWVKMAKMTLNIKVNDLHFQYQLRVSHDACLVQIWWFQLKSVTSYRADKVKFTDKQTDGQMDWQTDRWRDAGNDNTPSAWKARGKNHSTRCEMLLPLRYNEMPWNFIWESRIFWNNCINNYQEYSSSPN